MSPRNPYQQPPFTGRFDYLLAHRRRVLQLCLLVGVPFLIWRVVFDGPEWVMIFVLGAVILGALRAITPDERFQRTDTED